MNDDLLDTSKVPDCGVEPDDAELAELAGRLRAMTDQATLDRLSSGYWTAIEEHLATRGTDPFDAKAFIGLLHSTVPNDVDVAVVKVFDAQLARLLAQVAHRR
ncbi:hypothetical protein ACFXGA_18705 [Actinosynnema sp. NPDC059335]|uniref:hypothetical protein n=1 Tax=Actinosynnema sp. NPDC059335 TaxID=3346804 RepID=UPI00366B53FE